MAETLIGHMSDAERTAAELKPRSVSKKISKTVPCKHQRQMS